jgi:hypothetical protein
MARVNIDDRLFSDPRWMNFVLHVGCQDKAVGMYYRAVRLVQNHWRSDFLVPLKSWRTLKVPLEKFGLAEITKDGVYLHGSDKRLSWYKTRMAASEAGVAKKREKRKNHMDNHGEPYGQPNGKPTRNHMDNPPVPVPVPVLNSANALVAKTHGDAIAAAPPVVDKKNFASESEISHSDSHDSESIPFNYENTNADKPIPASACLDSPRHTKSNSVDEIPVKIDSPLPHGMIEKPAKKRAKKVVTPEEAAARSATRSAYIEAFQARYSETPRLAGKENTQICALVSAVGQQDAPFLVKFYLECSDEFLVNKAHPIGFLAANPNEYIVRMKNGQTHRERKSLFAKKPKEDKPSQEFIDEMIRKHAKC